MDPDPFGLFAGNGSEEKFVNLGAWLSVHWNFKLNSENSRQSCLLSAKERKKEKVSYKNKNKLLC